MPSINIQRVPHFYELTDPTVAPDVLVFIHGWLLSRHYWQPLIRQLSPTYQCLTYDLRGFGESQPLASGIPTSATSKDFSLQAYARDLEQFLKQLGMERVWLIGHSLGGSIALWAADRLPQQVQGVICVNAGGGIYLKEEFERFRSAGQQLVKLRPRWLCSLPLLDLLFTRASVVEPIARQWGRQRLVDFVVADQQAALGSLLESTTEESVHLLPQIVARLHQPVYFIAGSQDPIMDIRYVRHLASFHNLFKDQGANVLEISNCGHLAMVERPQQVSNCIHQILSQHSETGYC